MGRGYFEIQIVHEIHDQIQLDLKTAGLKPFAGIGICPHAPDENCHCRKPSPEMISQFLQKDQLSLKESFMVGDKLIDAEAGKNAGIQGILVRHSNSPEFPSYKTLLDFALSLK